MMLGFFKHSLEVKKNQGYFRHLDAAMGNYIISGFSDSQWYKVDLKIHCF